MKQLLTRLGICAVAAMALSMSEPEHKTTIYMIGDSTMANKNLEGGNQERGWGHVLPSFFTEDIDISNHAKNGRSTKSFIDEGRWDSVYQSMRAGDYLIIQFGHNDEKADEKRHTEPGSTYDANLRTFIEGAKKKGVTPIVCNSIVRRNFAVVEDAVAQDDASGQSAQTVEEGDSLIETHGEYLTAARRVAEEEGVLFIDMNKMTHDLVQELGPVKSRELYVWAEPNTVPAYPDGKKDNTHLNVRGARIVAGMAAKELQEKVPELAPYIRFYDITVAKDGSGDFMTIQEAINAVPDYSKKHRTTIMVNGGTYEEKVIVPESKINLSLIGQRGAKVTWGDYAKKDNGFGDICSTSGSSTFYVYANYFECEGMTFENSAGRVGQAVACLVSSSIAKFKKCRFLGNQDTLYTYKEGGYQTYEECYIEGTVDFIFGKAAAYFDKCEIRSLGNGFVAAPATPENQKFGYIFNECKLTHAAEADSVYLARPWKPYGQAIYVNCTEEGHITATGWNNWRNADNEKTAVFGEIDCTGEGVKKGRVDWARKKLKAKDYSYEKFVEATPNIVY